MRLDPSRMRQPPDCRRLARLALLAGLLALGCAADNQPLPLPELLPAGGRITVGGQPLAGAIVIFVPSASSAGFAAMGVTNADGRYELQTHAGDAVHPGVAAGDYRVTVTRMVGPDGSPLPPDLSQSTSTAGARESVARRYSLPAMTGLQATVAKDAATHDFEVSLAADSDDEVRQP